MKQQNIKATFAKYVSLNVLGTIGFSCYILADTFFIAQGVGAEGLTALNLALPVFSFIVGISLMIGMGAATRFAISKSKAAFTQAVYYILLITIILEIIGIFFSDNLALLLGADDETLKDTSIYLKTILIFTPMFLLNNVMQCFIRNDDRPGLAMTAMLLGSLSNIVLDYILVFPCGMGMLGAALATGSAPVLGVLIQSIHFIKRNNTFRIVRCLPRLRDFADISALGVSSLINELSSGIVILVFNIVILGLAGNIGVAAYGIIANIALVIMSVYMGISQGIQPIISDLYRLGDKINLKKVLKYSFTTSIVISIVILVISIVFADPIVSAFNKDNDLHLAELAVRGMKIYFTAFLFVGVNIVTSTYYSSIDRPKPAFVISLLRGFIVIVPMVVILSILMGMDGVWIAMTCSEIIVFAVAMGLLKRKR